MPSLLNPVVLFRGWMPAKARNPAIKLLRKGCILAIAKGNSETERNTRARNLNSAHDNRYVTRVYH